MNESWFRQQYETYYSPGGRMEALVERLEQYYRDTPVSMDNKTARLHWIEFRKWTASFGYTQQEINRAKAIAKDG